MVWLTAWSTVAVLLFEVLEQRWMSIPWLPISMIGIAVAFYVGFKNNSAYDRMWEARKIWGAIVNDSRSWGIAVRHFIADQFADENISEMDLQTIHRNLIYRHIAWLYTLRKQLLRHAPWEHINAKKYVSKVTEKRMKTFGVGVLNEEPYEDMMDKLLIHEEVRRVSNAANGATALIDMQAKAIAGVRKSKLTDDFRHMEMQKLLNLFYTHQGKCERIKNYPLPRQYASMSLIFIGIFIFLLPCMMPEFHKLGGSHFA